MTTRDVYFKTLVETELSVGFMFYTCIDSYAKYTTNNILLTFSTDDLISSKEIDKMVEIEKSDDFMFWNNTPEAEKFYNGVKFKLNV
jgi:hypothetical protein